MSNSSLRADLPVVRRHDLRPPGAARRFTQDRVAQESGRTLVIAYHPDLAEVESTLFDIAASPGVQLICVVIGVPSHDVDRPALALPAMLATEGIATLWVSDPAGAGCGWWIETGGPALDAAQLLGSESASALDLLDDCLQVPDVFDAVRAQVEQMADHVASPGLLAISGRITGELLRTSLRLAVTQLCADTGRDRRPELAHFVASAPALSGPADVDRILTDESELHRHRTAAASAADAAADQVRRMAWLRHLLGPDRPSRTVVERIDRVRAERAELVRVVADLLTSAQHPGNDPSGQALRDDLRNRGILLPDPPEESNPGALLTKLRVDTSRLWRTSNVGVTQRWLRALADRATPQGSGRYLPQLTRLRPDAGPVPEFPLPVRPGWLLLILTAASLAAGLAGPPGAVVPLSAALLVLMLLACRPAARGEAGVASAARPLLTAYLPAMAAATAAGVLIAGLIGPPPLIVRIALVGIAAAAALVAVHHWWRGAVARWSAQLEPMIGPQWSSGIDALLHRVVHDEWRTVPARALLADAAVSAAVALDRATAVLRDRIGPSSTPTATAPYGEPASDVDGDLVEVLAADLRDAVASALDVVWDRAGSGGSLSGSWDQVDDVLIRHLDDYRRHLESHHVSDAPPFADRSRVRAGVDAGWGGPERLGNVLATAFGGPLVQLCQPRHLGLLSREHLSGVRFAPAALRDRGTAQLRHRGGGQPLAEMTWTESGVLAGVLRLVPPRQGVAQTYWRSNDDEAAWWADSEGDHHVEAE
ncbi:hypothetical protein O7632_22620 [Solwaraspora sp. WMMD406]|uniref:hypothetical protein n=1 Tax=Solwaraspora sp. WMMD406 TaxID=3016095 RepID=UPI002416A67F|nr:hypothetical protein [Solwaraspora sp. WMMD406]MDG4766871.1 hypothetical protein [Solwaraspora sp. WMMD406]